jgi:hypothetical protein
MLEKGIIFYGKTGTDRTTQAQSCSAHPRMKYFRGSQIYRYSELPYSCVTKPDPIDANLTQPNIASPDET